MLNALKLGVSSQRSALSIQIAAEGEQRTGIRTFDEPPGPSYGLLATGYGLKCDCPRIDKIMQIVKNVILSIAKNLSLTNTTTDSSLRSE